MAFFRTCKFCGRFRLRVTRAKLYSPVLKMQLVSDSVMCKKCSDRSQVLFNTMRRDVEARERFVEESKEPQLSDNKKANGITDDNGIKGQQADEASKGR